ncbi:sensor histidine kinase [Niallia oryzisoli]|uniref:sensor histidine kinase n=1 Tax=Niallia oryzisoli TaxID=1737571 RepID=UPI0037357D9D
MKLKSISLKLGLWFSTIFIALLLILGFILYGIFTNFLTDFIEQDLVARGNNHARNLEGQFTKEAIEHAIGMERGVSTRILITDSNHQILGSSIEPNEDMMEQINIKKSFHEGQILENDWQDHEYIVSVSPVGNDSGYVYMYYPSSKLKDMTFVMSLLSLITSLGIMFVAFGLIGILSRLFTKPLLSMKNATIQMAQGQYKQKIPVKGNDEIAQLGNSIQALGEQLQYYETTRNEFLAAVSHEIRTPLTYIKGYSDVLSKGIIDSREEQEEYLKIITKEVNRLSFLVNDLFEMSKLQVGKFELTKEPAKMNDIIKKIITNLKPAADRKELELKGEYKADVLFPVDVRRMEQALYNLIENAIKYSDKGKVTVISFLQNEFLVIEIKDTGIGIPEKDLTKIWERFYRVDQSRTRKTGGTGLGLYVAKQIIESHGGYITVKSKENEGSVFSIFLKAKSEI